MLKFKTDLQMDIIMVSMSNCVGIIDNFSEEKQQTIDKLTDIIYQLKHSTTDKQLDEMKQAAKKLYINYNEKLYTLAANDMFVYGEPDLSDDFTTEGDDGDFRRSRFLNYITNMATTINHVTLPDTSIDHQLILEGFKKQASDLLSDVNLRQLLANEYIPELCKEVNTVISTFRQCVKSQLGCITHVKLPNSIALSVAYIVNDYTDRLNKFIDNTYVSKDMMTELTSAVQHLTDLAKSSHPDTVNRIKEVFDETDKKLNTYFAKLSTHLAGDFDVNDFATFETPADLKLFISRCVVMAEASLKVFRSNRDENKIESNHVARMFEIINQHKWAIEHLRDLYLTIPEDNLSPELQQDRWYTATSLLDSIIYSFTSRI